MFRQNKALTASIAILVALLISTLTLLSEHYVKQSFEQQIHQDMENSHALFDSMLQQTYSNLLMVASLYAEEDYVQELFQKGVEAVERESIGAENTGGTESAKWRNALYTHIRPSWEKASQKYQLRQLHFHIAPGDSSFLRVHKPEKFGDDLSAIRHTITETLRTQQEQYGFETGRIYSGLRGVVPIYSSNPENQRLLGALEAGSSFSHLLEILNRNMESEIAVLLYNDHIHSTMWPETVKEYFGKQKLPCDCVIEATTSPDTERVIHAHQQLHNNPSAHDHKIIDLIHFKDRTLAASIYPLYDFHNQTTGGTPVGQILIWNDVTAAHHALTQQVNRGRVVGVAIYLLLLMMLIFSIRWYTDRLRSAVTQRTQDLSEAQRLSKTGSWVYNVQHSKLEWSDEIYHIFGFDKTRFTPSYEAFLDAIHPEDRDKVHQTYTNSLKQQCEYKIDHRLLLADGEVKYVQEIGSTSYAEDGTPLISRGTVQDITVEKKNEQALVDTYEELIQVQQQLKGFAQAASDWFWEMDSELRFSYFSDRLQEISGLDPKKILGKRRDEIGVHPLAEDAMETHIAQLERHEPFRDFIYATEKEGETVWLSINGDPIIDVNGNFQGYRGTGTNVTDKIISQQRIAEEQKKAAQTKDDFLASMSHELRTPLASIIGNSELLLEECDAECAHESRIQLIRSIETAGRNQLALVNDILDMSKIQSGKFTIEETPYNLEALLREVDAMLSVKAKDSGSRLTISQKPPQQQTYLVGDAQRINQILLNLIGNAIKFTHEGEISVTSWNSPTQLYIEVKDNGIGMPQTVVEKLFQRFEQADGSTSRRFGGTGLGLFISQSLAELMGGSIKVSSSEGVGSTFTLILPYVMSATLIKPQKIPVHQAGGNKDQLHGSVLIAEDTPELQLLERRILESLGVSVTLANNGKEAVELAQKESFDLILMDMQMPEMNGLEATERLYRENNPTPVVPLTANVMQKHRDAFAALGCQDFLGKPIDRQELKGILQKYLKSETNNNTTLDDELVTIFMKSAQENRDSLQNALSEQQWEKVQSIAHRIKGSASSFGYPDLALAASRLQQAIDSGDKANFTAYTEALIEQLDQLLIKQ